MLVKIILALAPFLSQGTASSYARHVEHQARTKRIDPVLVLAVIWVESRFRSRARSRTNDYGLMQLHVSRRTHRRFRGREKLLFQPKRNIRLGAAMLKFWRWHHRTRCKGRHHWVGHYNMGVYVQSRLYERKVKRALKRIRLLAARLRPEV